MPILDFSGGPLVVRHLISSTNLPSAPMVMIVIVIIVVVAATLLHFTFLSIHFRIRSASWRLFLSNIIM